MRADPRACAWPSPLTAPSTRRRSLPGAACGVSAERSDLCGRIQLERGA
jgi:hypothetical protein